MNPTHDVIIIPGLGDNNRSAAFLRILTNHWNKYGLRPQIFPVGWHEGESFLPKLKRITTCVDQLTKQDHRVSLVGTSAGGSAALNAFIEDKNHIHRIVNVCGRLKKGPLTGFRSFSSKTKSSLSFAQAVILFEEKEHTLRASDRKRILTIHSKFGDELVPPETTMIPGAINTDVPTIEHILSISAALTIFSKQIIDFLQD